jgi:hypothetical protein
MAGKKSDRARRGDFARRRHEERLKEMGHVHAVPYEISEPPWEEANGSNDALVVSTRALAHRIRAWRAAWDAEALVQNSDGFRENDAVRMTSMQYLEEWSGTQSGMIRAILREQTEWTSMKVADGLMTAMGEQHLLALDPALHPRPNPRWTQERWMKWKEEQGCV